MTFPRGFISENTSGIVTFTIPMSFQTGFLIGKVMYSCQFPKIKLHVFLLVSDRLPKIKIYVFLLHLTCKVSCP